MIWIIIIPILLAVLLGGYSLMVTSTLPTLIFGWWMLLVLAVASAAVSYWLRGRRRVMWSGIVITSLSVIIFATMTALNWNSATDRTSLTPGASPPAAPAAAPAVTPSAPAQEPTPTPSESWSDTLTEWLTWIGNLIGTYWLPVLAGVFLFVLFGTLLWRGLKKLYASGSSWFTVPFTILVLVVGSLAAADYFIGNSRHTIALWRGIVAGWNNTPPLGSTGASGEPTVVHMNAGESTRRVTVNPSAPTVEVYWSGRQHAFVCLMPEGDDIRKVNLSGARVESNDAPIPRGRKWTFDPAIVRVYQQQGKQIPAEVRIGRRC